MAYTSNPHIYVCLDGDMYFLMVEAIFKKLQGLQVRIWGMSRKQQGTFFDIASVYFDKKSSLYFLFTTTTYIDEIVALHWHSCTVPKIYGRFYTLLLTGQFHKL